MKKNIKIISLMILTMTTLSQARAGVHWGYEGNELPENWAKLSPEYQMCGQGKNQSPINIANTIQADIKPLDIHYGKTDGNIVNNGHTVQITEKDQNDYILLDGQKYTLTQFHFHATSENQIDGKSFPMEGHFVHTNSQGDLLVMAIMFKEGSNNNAADQLLAKLNDQENTPANLDGINIAALLPKQTNYYRFSGSLTTPPCSEGVTWIVLKEPMELSKTEIDKFTKAFKHHNNRPIQPLHGRLIINN